jgi:predicted SAM-dependent methyltransferase
MSRRIVKVNLGCGPKGVVGWINIDRSYKVYLSRFPILKYILRILSWLRLISRIAPEEEFPAELKIIRCDVTKGLPFNDAEVDYIYSSHMFEHLTRDELIFVLKECYRVLKTGGVLRIVVPDLEILIKNYLSHKQNNDVMAADKFMESLGLHCLRPKKPLFNRIFGGKGHQWMYDFDSLSHRLRMVGFKKIRRCEPNVGKVPDLQLLGEGELHPNSLYLEAEK